VLDKTPFVANTWALAITMISGFILHHAFTFENRFYSWAQVYRFAGVVAIGSLLNYLILLLFISIIKQVYIAKFIQIILLSLYNFNMYKYVVFFNKK
jgi:putative flippase GtrA